MVQKMAVIVWVMFNDSSVGKYNACYGYVVKAGHFT
jgi:hypothetical protein